MFVEPPENVITLCLKKGAQPPLLDAACVLITTKINWKKLLVLLEKENLLPVGGAVFELLIDSGVDIPGWVINRLKPAEQRTSYPFYTLEPKNFIDLGNKWNVELHIPQSFIKTLKEDLLWMKC